MRAPAFWWREQASGLARLLSPLGAIYGAVTARRMSRSGVESDVPVLCIGNFVAGGAGKTPAAIACAQVLAASGERPMFLSRGYGGALSSTTPLRVDPARHDAAMVGDEPLLLARVAPVFICTDRVAGAKAAALAGASIVVMDDGLQNPALAKVLSLAVVDGATGVGNGLCLPAGPLRAPLDGQLRAVEAVLIVGPGRAGDGVAAQVQAGGLPVFTGRLAPAPDAVERLRGKAVFAFAGIGRPEKFFDTLRGCGARIVGRRAFADHHAYTQGDLDSVSDAARLSGAEIIVTTEKDACRLPVNATDFATLPVTLSFGDPAAITAWLATIRARRA
ncbi:MAG: tetraacyldisaccharide 4-kinase [Hyphomicrobiales bacterium]|nr:tetraacyldisaccharide 4-kinase [Hyphomicrobiales bacterium]